MSTMMVTLVRFEYNEALVSTNINMLLYIIAVKSLLFSFTFSH